MAPDSAPIDPLTGRDPAVDARFRAEPSGKCRQRPVAHLERIEYGEAIAILERAFITPEGLVALSAGLPGGAGRVVLGFAAMELAAAGSVSSSNANNSLIAT